MASHKYSNCQIVGALKKNNYVMSHTAKYLSMSLQNLYYLLKVRPKLKLMIDQAKEERLDIAENVLDQLVLAGSFPAVKFILETRGRSRGYGNKIEVSHVDESEEIIAALRLKYAKPI